MSDCSNQDKQQLNGANPPSSNSGALNVNLNVSKIFNPNAALAAAQIFNVLNNTANKMFGIELKWFRAIPQQRSKDIIFKEYTLSNVDNCPLEIKAIVTDGNVPDSKYQYDLMGLEYEVPFEIQIDKKYWEEIAGFATGPQKKDIVYVPISNKLYQVESSFLKRGFMEQETTWVINLRKYQEEASRKESDGLKNTINDYTVSETELFSELQTNEIEKISNDKQFSPFNSTERDKYKELDSKLQIINNNLFVYDMLVSETYYDLNTSELFNAVSYKNSQDIIKQSNYDRSVMSWIYPRTIDNKEYNIESIEQDTTLTSPANYKIKVQTTRNFNIDDTFIISRSAALTLYATVIDIADDNSSLYYCKINSTVEKYLQSINNEWYNLRNFKMKLKSPISIIDGLNGTSSGYKINLYANKFVEITYIDTEYVSILENALDDNTWYGLVVNIGNTWNQYNVYVWDKDNDKNTKLKIKHYETIKFNGKETIVQEYTINKSPAYMTNIRLFNCTIEEEKQKRELISYFSNDADIALILDNCDIKLKSPYISSQR